jgi:hypothetical protein
MSTVLKAPLVMTKWFLMVASVWITLIGVRGARMTTASLILRLMVMVMVMVARLAALAMCFLMAASVWITLTGVRVVRLTTVPRILMMIQEEVMIQVVVRVVVLSSPPLMLLT